MHERSARFSRGNHPDIPRYSLFLLPLHRILSIPASSSSLPLIPILHAIILRCSFPIPTVRSVTENVPRSLLLSHSVCVIWSTNSFEIGVERLAIGVGDSSGKIVNKLRVFVQFYEHE